MKNENKNQQANSPIIVSKGTLVPISFVITIIGFSAWITYIAHTTNANAQSIRDMNDNGSKVLIELRSMNTRLSRIEGKLNGLRNGR
jgi:hypothetical protein